MFWSFELLTNHFINENVRWKQLLVDSRTPRVGCSESTKSAHLSGNKSPLASRGGIVGKTCHTKEYYVRNLSVTNLICGHCSGSMQLFGKVDFFSKHQDWNRP